VAKAQGSSIPLTLRGGDERLRVACNGRAASERQLCGGDGVAKSLLIHAHCGFTRTTLQAASRVESLRRRQRPDGRIWRSCGTTPTQSRLLRAWIKPPEAQQHFQLCVAGDTSYGTRTVSVGFKAMTARTTRRRHASGATRTQTTYYIERMKPVGENNRVLKGWWPGQ